MVVIVILIAANVLTVFTQFFKVFNNSKYDPLSKQPETLSVINANEINNGVVTLTGPKEAGAGYYVSLVIIIVAALAEAGLIIASLMKKGYMQVKLLVFASLCAIGQLLMTVVLKSSLDSKKLEFSSWYFILLVVSIEALCAEIGVMNYIKKERQ